ncbi:hypothetical protein O6H91_06G046900 [Diphasiastrum complanatum]|uniref:Uncharacterized protein n=1 Tax=Diphasiastrum complanatum TaxID=34168 RepID=A0ACC2DD68_DIPCM|nr:hypothetical protein O6H91_06G046900 [Diphasiastrum complanatum]
MLIKSDNVGSLRKGIGCILKSRKTLRYERLENVLCYPPHYAGPFHIVKKLNQNAYQLDLPQGISVHPAFHISHFNDLVERMN